MQSELTRFCGDCGVPVVATRRYCKSCRQRRGVISSTDALATQRRGRISVRRDTFAHYGPEGRPECTCCGEANFEFLGLDHIDGGGRQHMLRINRPGGTTFYYWLRKRGWPDGYRTLCNNCNHALGHYGYCPHHRL